MIGLRARGREHLITAHGVRRELHQVAKSGADFLMILVPIHHHGSFSSSVNSESGAIILSTRVSVICFPVHASLPGCEAVVARGTSLSLCASGAIEPIPRSRIHEEFV